MSNATVREATTDAEILACWPVMSELRPHVPREEFLERVRRQARQGYRLACVLDGGIVCAVAGFVVAEKLAWGRHLYLDDLVTSAQGRSRGHGRTLVEWLADTARREGCQSFHLDSGVQRHGAHRFYLRERFDITSHHFARPINDSAKG